MPPGNLSRDVEYAAEYVSLDFKREVWTRDKYFGVTNIRIKLEIMR